MAIPFCILGVYNMANGLEHIADILKRLNDELKLDNDKWEREQNGRPILPGSDGFSPAPLTLLNQERWNDGDVQQVRKVWEGGI